MSDTSGYIYLRDVGYEHTLSSVYNKDVPKSHKVSKTSFDDIIRRYPNFIDIDLLSIDFEGYKKEVLEDLKNNNFYAKIIILEINKRNLSTLSNLDALKNQTAKYTNGVNTFFLNKNLDFPCIDNLPEGFLAC